LRPRTLSRPSATTLNDAAVAGFVPKTVAKQKVRAAKLIADLESRDKRIRQSRVRIIGRFLTD
jgi:hypothetical protein